MSSPFALAAVTAVLKDLLDNAMADHSIVTAAGAPVTVTALPPSRVKTDDNEQTQLNLFLYHVTPNQGWRNVGLPSRNGRGERLTNPPLALDLHYMLTAYSKEDFKSEILLGYAMHILHEVPVLTREAIRKTLASPSPVGGGLPSSLGALSAADLADQVEQIKLTLQPMNTEEMSKLWTALQTNYRPTVIYQASVVLIEGRYPARSPLPVLTRGPQDRGVVSQPDLLPPFPTLTAVVPPNQQPSASLGDLLTVQGRHLEGQSVVVRFTNPRLRVTNDLTPQPGATATEFKVRLPNDAAAAANWPSGFYTVSAIISRAGEPTRTTNEWPCAIAPQITTALPLSRARDGNGDVTLALDCRPEVRPTQDAALLLGDRQISASDHPTQIASLSFAIKKAPPGEHFVRLRVDGVESLLVNCAVTPPVFDATQKITIL